MVHQLRLALLVLFLGATAIVGWNLLEAQDRIFQSNVPGIDPSNPLAQYGIESDEHRAYVAAKVRDVRWNALQLETGIVTVALVIWLAMPVMSKSWTKEHEREI
ncbi:MAG TPA: hypothetical protein VNF68_10055 [Candidatus Baltobacteraceae bacterium]|nr:hypothetical protein [Candidatus Baltobacteraceae bacterium]